ncbi:MAG: shikimate kinase / 3-dehydroquinate synthase [Solirubrobacteraceae bacterium]|nr:shikimate kinase / 3-dehydroquinate synthase [Solirubrobacteraceae bacterium]
MSLVLIGFMGAGKSTAARRLAGALGVEAADSDRVLEDELGCSIEAFFDREGEAAFREREERVVLELLDRDVPVLAVGGGAVLSERVRAALRAHTVALLEIDVETAWERAAGRGRPLARDRDAFAERHAERLAIYEGIADAFVPHGAAIAEVAGAVGAMEPGTRLVWARSASGSYPVWFGEHVWPRPGRCFVLTDESVARLYAHRMPDVGLAIAPGEASKSLATAQVVWEALAAAGHTRADTLLAVGGGVVGDLGGFCAATYQRGMPVVHVPTTVVAQVDSAYGGKTGVDLPQAKNYVGAYHQPAAVHVVPSTLESLPARERAAGYAEVVKTALIAGGALWDSVLAGARDDPDTVLACARTKLRIVAADERDAGLRQVLNLGHTVAHALETVTGYTRLLHGEAVALGLLAALRLSGQDALRGEVAELLAGAGLTLAVGGVDPVAVARATRMDKKRVGERVPFVLVEAPGAVTPGHAVEDRDLLLAVQELVA